jgi:hypothetical protein
MKTYQMDVHFLDQIRSRRTHKKCPVVLVIVARISDKPVLVAYENHNALKAIAPNTRPSLFFLFHTPFGICDGVFLFQVPCQRVVRSRRGTCPAHGTVGFEIVRRVVVWIKVREVHIPAGMLDRVRVGRVGPLRHAGRA